MQWQLLSQHYVTSEYQDLNVSLLEVVVSSQQQLALVLVSGLVSIKTMLCLLSRLPQVETLGSPMWEWI